MTLLLQTSAVRIFDHADGSVVGAGFLADTNIVLTCAHVIASALSIAETSPSCPKQSIILDFPLVEARKWLTAKVVHWVEVKADGSGDIAVLRLDGPAPAEARIARLVKTDDYSDHPFRAFGYPPRQEDGVPSTGKLEIRNAKGWVVMQTTETTGFRVQRGFSGSAVWDGDLDGVAGMVVAEESDPAPRVAYMIPAQVLIVAWPELGQQAIRSCPYRGLFAFREQDAPYFFGREADIQRLLDAVRRKPLVAVIGASGSGKSSLVGAGLIPALRTQGDWIVATFRPFGESLKSLAEALVPLLEPQMSERERIKETREWAKDLRNDASLCADFIERVVKQQAAERLLLVVDQFEELYTLSPDEQEQHAFLDALLAALRAAAHQRMPLLSLVLTLRADFVGQTTSYKPLADALQEASFFVGPMGRAELEEAIRGPAQKLHVQVEEGLSTRLLGEVGQSASDLPLLEFALTQLWSRQQEGRLTLAAYEEIGGLKEALGRHAEDVWARLNADEQRQAQALFTRLIRPGEGTEDTRRVMTHAALGATRWSLVAQLASERLVVTGRDPATTQETVEVIHEALIRGWQRLRGWIDADRKFLTWCEGLGATRRQWEQSGQDPGGLLRGLLLVEALDWLSRRADDLTEGERAFLHASQEHERQEREHLQALLEEAQRQRREAERQQQIALARSLAAQAELLRTQYPDNPRLLERSTLMALEGLQRFVCPETIQAVRQGMELLRQRLAALRHEGFVWAVAFSPDGRLLATGSNDHTAGIWDVTSGQRLAVLRHEDSVEAVAFSPDGRLLATRTNDHTAGIWDVTSGQRLAVLRHEYGVEAVAFSPDGRLLATGSRDSTARLWDVASGQRLAVLPHKGDVWAVAFSPDGHLLASVSVDHTARLWDVASGQCLAVLPHEDDVWAVAFSPDGRLLATGSKDHTARLWEVVSGRHQAVLRHEDDVWEVAFSPDGRLLATRSDDDTARLWEVVSGQRLAVLRHEYGVEAMAFSPDGRLLATGSWDRTAGLWEVVSGQRLAVLPHEGFVSAVAFSPDGHLLATASWDNTTRLWKVAGSQAVLRHEDNVSAVAFSPDGHLLATGSRDHTARLWDVASGQRLAVLRHEDNVSAVAFSPDGHLLVTCSDDHTARLWDVASGQRLAVLPHEGNVRAVAFSPDGHLLATGSWKDIAGLWDVASGQRLAVLPHEGSVSAVAFSPDGRLLATGSWKDVTGLWDVISGGQSKLAVPRDEDDVQAVAFSPDGRLLATGSWKDIAGLWDVASGQCLAVLPHDGNVWTVAFSPDGHLLATGSRDRTARLWDVASGQCLAMLPHEGDVWTVAFSPDGHLLATGSVDHTARLWDVASGQCLAVLPHEGDVWTVAFGPDGSLLATGSRDRTAKLWDVASGQCLAVLPHEDDVWAVAFSPDGHLLATGSWDRTVRLWLHLPADLIAETRARLSRNLTPEEWQQYLGDEPYRKTVPDLQ